MFEVYTLTTQSRAILYENWPIRFDCCNAFMTYMYIQLLWFVFILIVMLRWHWLAYCDLFDFTSVISVNNNETNNYKHRLCYLFMIAMFKYNLHMKWYDNMEIYTIQW